MRRRELVLAGVLAVAVSACGQQVEETFSGIGEELESPEGRCESVAANEVAVLTDAWTGNGAFTYTDAQRAPSTNSTFDHVVYLKGDAPGMPGQVFVFAVGGDDLNNTTGLLVGADAVTREFFDWGSAATSDSPMAQEARAAVDAAPQCLS